jgi:hypothetical protein
MKKWSNRVFSSAWAVLFHGLAVVFVAVLTAMPTLDLHRAEMLWKTYATTSFELNWLRVGLHLGLAACLWALAVIAFLWGRERRKDEKKVTRLVKKARGTVITEFLIIFVPFLLLLSGLAQLAILNVTALLADLAVYNAARTVWLWEPEVRQDRFQSSVNENWHLTDRARTAAMNALAPTVPNDYEVNRAIPTGSSNYVRRQRAVIVGAFMPDRPGGGGIGTPGTPQYNYDWSGGYRALHGGGAYDIDFSGRPGDGDTRGQNLTFLSAFDKWGFKWRASRKSTQAEWGLWDDFETVCPASYCDQSDGDEVGIHFTYYYNLAFPWFGYIWGENLTVAHRTGWYAPIERRHTFPRQPMP